MHRDLNCHTTGTEEIESVANILAARKYMREGDSVGLEHSVDCESPSPMYFRSVFM